MRAATDDDRVVLHRFYEIVCADRDWVSEEFAAIVQSLGDAATATATVPHPIEHPGFPFTRTGGVVRTRNGNRKITTVGRLRSPPRAQQSHRESRP